MFLFTSHKDNNTCLNISKIIRKNHVFITAIYSELLKNNKMQLAITLDSKYLMCIAY